MGGGGSGDEGQVHIHPGLCQPPGGGHGDVVDPGDVAQGFEGGELHPQAHQLVEKLPPPRGQKAAVLPGLIAGLVLLLGEKLKVQHGVEGQDGALVVQQNLEDCQVELRPSAAPLRLGGKAALGEHEAADVLVGELPPALLGRNGTQRAQDRGAQLQNAGAAQPLPDGKQGGQPLVPGGGVHQPLENLAAGQNAPRPPGGQGL